MKNDTERLITQCYVCQSQNVINDVETSTDGLRRPLGLRCNIDLKSKKYGFFGAETTEKESRKVEVRASVCKDCGSIRFYVMNPNEDWIRI